MLRTCWTVATEKKPNTAEKTRNSTNILRLCLKTKKRKKETERNRVLKNQKSFFRQRRRRKRKRRSQQVIGDEKIG